MRLNSGDTISKNFVKIKLINSLFGILFLFIGRLSVHGQKIYSVEHDYQADVKVYGVDSDYKTDLVVFKTDKEYRAKKDENKGIWFFADKSYRADKKVFFVDREYKSDLKVFFTDKEYTAVGERMIKNH